jgi:hypothetical protein
MWRRRDALQRLPDLLGPALSSRIANELTPGYVLGKG